jgi:hypothetical protein
MEVVQFYTDCAENDAVVKGGEYAMDTKVVLYYGREQSLSNQFSFFTHRELIWSESFEFGWLDDGALGWTKSWRKNSREWHEGGGITEADLPTLLQKFGLSDASDSRLKEFETARYLSPATLIAIRRTWEKATGASYLEVASDRAGGHIPAEMVTGPFD